MNLTRRSLVGAGGAVLVGLLAGCLTTGAAGGPAGEPTTDGGSDGDGGASGTRPAGTGGPGLALVSADDAPDLPVRPSVEVVRDVATAEHPPRVRVTLTNESDAPVRVGEARAVVFEYVTDVDGQLTLLPAGDDWPAEPDCWRLTEPIAVTEEYRTTEIAPGGSFAAAVDVYGTAPGGSTGTGPTDTASGQSDGTGPTDTASDACLPVGTFRFETTISVLDREVEPESSATWGFDVSLE